MLCLSGGYNLQPRLYTNNWASYDHGKFGDNHSLVTFLVDYWVENGWFSTMCLTIES